MHKKKLDIKSVIIALLAVALLGALGYIVYDTFFKKEESPVVKEEVKPPVVKEEKKPAEVVKKEVCAPHEKLCLKYPANWTVKVEESEYPSRDSAMAAGMAEEDFTKMDVVTLASQDGSAQVNLHSGVTGIGGACFPGESGKTYVFEQRKTSLTGYQAQEGLSTDAYAVSLVVSNAQGTEFTPKIGLTQNLSLINQKEADGCAGHFFSMIDGRNVKLSENAGGGYGSVLVGTKSVFPDGAAPEKTYPSLEEARKSLDSEANKQALEIIASAYYK